MALTVAGTVDTPYGTTVSGVYWRWVGLAIDTTTAQATIMLFGYVNEAAFTARKQPITQKQYTISTSDFLALATEIETPGNPGLSNVIYTHVKTKPEFAGAKDA